MKKVCYRMKWLCTLGVLLVSLLAVAQAPTPPPPKANVILIVLPDKGSVAWERVGRLLLARGYTFKSSNERYRLIETNPKPLGPAGTISLSVAISGNQVTLQGTQVRSLQLTNPITNQGSKSSPTRRAWEEMHAVAVSLGGNLSYSAITYID